MTTILRRYFSTSLLVRILAAFVIGSAAGGALWFLSVDSVRPVSAEIIPYIAPFGTLLVNMLKMIVVPVIFFSLVAGAASLPIKRFGRIGVKVLGWYLFCSLLAAGVGTVLALLVNPGGGSELQGWQELTATLGSQSAQLEESAETGGAFLDLLLGMFQNPFKALSSGNFLPIIVFSVLFGLGIRVSIEASSDAAQVRRMETLLEVLNAARDAIFKMVDWILEYTPIGVLALSVTNFGLYGPNIVGPYVSVTLGVVGGILVMVVLVYPALLFAVTRQNPFRIMKGMEEAMITAFMTRSSAATLPVSIRTMEEDLRVRNELASFSLPLGATVNMDGVCVHLPMFAVLAANMFDLELTAGGLVVLVLTTVLASIGAGGVPGGSIMLLFIILQAMGLGAEQVAIIAALALGINPILDMFETANNVTGDMVGTYAVARMEGLVEENGQE